jgi:lysosomal-associated transmembrane protein
LTVAWMGIVLCLIYGTIRGISKYITPFFCVQMFDLCLTGLTMLSSFSDLAYVRNWINAQDNRFPFKQELANLDNDHLTLVTLIIFVAVLSVKAYFIGVVWTCYKYLKLYETMSHNGRTRLYDSEEVRPEDTELLLPPKYEDVLMMPPVQDGPAPPAYTPNTPAQQQ